MLRRKPIALLFGIAALCIVTDSMAQEEGRPKPVEPQGFCGTSTSGPCKEDADCMRGGCSSEVCQSKSEPPAITICISNECFDANRYGMQCACVESRCQWTKRTSQ